MTNDLPNWYKDHEQQLSGITEQLPYAAGQVITNLPLFIQTQLSALSFPETSIFYRNAYERLERLREYLEQHHNASDT